MGGKVDASFATPKKTGEFGCHFEQKEDCSKIIGEALIAEAEQLGKTNQGLEFCFKCGTKTVKVSTGMFSTYDICPNCKI